MGRRVVSASSQYLEWQGTPPITAFPFSLAIWFNPASAVSGDLLDLCASTAGKISKISVQTRNTSVIRALLADNSSGISVATTATFVLGKWNHACGIFRSASDVDIYLNASGLVNGNPARTPVFADLNNMIIGASHGNAAYGNFQDSIVAEAAIWKVGLSPADVLALYSGQSPASVRQSSLAAYWPILGKFSPEPEAVALYQLTNTGTIPSLQHPLIIPSHPRVLV